MIPSDCQGMGYYEPEHTECCIHREQLAALRARLAESEAREQAILDAIVCRLVDHNGQPHNNGESHTWYCCARKRLGGAGDCSKDCEQVRSLLAAAQPSTARPAAGGEHTG